LFIFVGAAALILAAGITRPWSSDSSLPVSGLTAAQQAYYVPTPVPVASAAPAAGAPPAAAQAAAPAH